MKNMINFLKDCLDAFTEAYKYAELDFFKLKNEVVILLDRARSKGYIDPAYCEMTIQVKNSFETDVQIQVFYKNFNGKYYRFKSNLDIGKLTNIPYTIKNKLDSDKTVTVKLSDFQNLYSVKEKEIQPTIKFESLRTFTFREATVLPIRKELSIKDELFYYVVDATYVYDNNKCDTKRKYYGNINNIPKDVLDKMSVSDENECSLDVTC